MVLCRKFFPPTESDLAEPEESEEDSDSEDEDDDYVNSQPPV